jgi:uncharacterized membrane protein YhiD involved in acid resistance
MKSLFGIIAILSIAGFGFYLHQEVGVWAAAALGVISVIGAMAYLVVLVMNGVRQNERDNTHETLYIGAEVFKNYATVHAAHARGNLEQVKADNKIRVLSYKEAERAAREQLKLLTQNQEPAQETNTWYHPEEMEGSITVVE